jgi:hypothetical protein
MELAVITWELRQGTMLKLEHKHASGNCSQAAAKALLNKFLNGEITTLTPVFDSKTGYSYPQAEAVVGSAGNVEVLLNKLTQQKMLTRKLVDKALFCPQCGSASISFRYCCPFCKSFDIQKSNLIEHVKCGYLDVEEKFRKGGKLICPKCHEEIKHADVDYRKAGVWCVCQECQKSFDMPISQHYCTSCHSVSSFEDAVIKDVYSYSLAKSAKRKISLDMLLLQQIQDLFIEKGFKVESPAYLVGKSGAKHSFNLAAYKEGTRTGVTVLDVEVSSEGVVSEHPVIALFAKKFDVSPDRAFLVAVPKLGDNASKMTDLYGIQAIEATTQAEVIALLKSKLEK